MIVSLFELDPAAFVQINNRIVGVRFLLRQSVGEQNLSRSNYEMAMLSSSPLVNHLVEFISDKVDLRQDDLTCNSIDPKGDLIFCESSPW